MESGLATCLEFRDEPLRRFVNSACDLKLPPRAGAGTQPAAGGASDANRSGCELGELGELRAARSSCAPELAVSHAWSQGGAQHRRHVAAREVASLVFTAAVVQVVRRARNVRFRSRGGVVPVVASLRSTPSHSAPPATSAHVYCDAPSITTDVRQRRRAGGAGS